MGKAHLTMPRGVEVRAPVANEHASILTPAALEFLATLVRHFASRREKLLHWRVERQHHLVAGAPLDFPSSTASIREAKWTVAPVVRDLTDRRVEITGPTERKMIINALNSGANVFMADFEDSLTPTWPNLIEGQFNLCDAVRRRISFTSPEGKRYALNEKTATLMVRPRGWHLPEKHVWIDGHPISASLFDFGLYFFHNARELLDRGTGPYFYLPKMESHLEARLWNDLFNLAQEELLIPRGSVRATVLIETIFAAFEMDEILYELREHSAGLNCGRWDYLFSCIKKFHHRPDFVFADRALVTMTSPFMRAYTQLAIKTCHRRKTHAMGGMAAQIPIKNDPKANEAALAKVRMDKEREATDGHDGTWVAHPGLVDIAREIFDRVMPRPNQIDKTRDDVNVTAADLLALAPNGPITENGLRANIDVGLQYLGGWLAGVGCVPIHNLMEDAATAEISRSQAWQWIHSPKGVLDDGRKVTVEMFRKFVPEELANIRRELGEKQWAAGRYEMAAQMFDRLTTSDDYAEFLTLPLYECIE